MNKRFPEGGTLVEERCVANMLDPAWKGIHLKAKSKYDVTKQLIKLRWEHLEGEDQREREQESKAPLSPTSKLLREVGGMTQEDLGGGVGAELLRFEVLPRLDKDGDRLMWWKIHEASLPMLSMIVKEIFAIPASSSKSERLFSIGTQVRTVLVHYSTVRYNVVQYIIC